MWSMKAFKAPGPDGLHVGFFQRFWLVVGNSVKKEVKQIFMDSKMPEFLNRTNMALIPKIAGPETLGSYRPISLCNTVYKLVTKIIVARLRPHLDKLVSPMQSAFISGRKGVDNAIVVQELIHTISSKKGRVGFLAIKVDLEKAYDKIEWSFIREVLLNANLPKSWWILFLVVCRPYLTLFSSMGVMWRPSIHPEVLGKETRFPCTSSLCVWRFLVT